jgi:nucleotide-binding universal stress UspA family protein
MTRTILVPFDSSPRAGLAVRYAEAIACAGGGQLLLYCAIPDEALRPYAEYQLARLAEQAGKAGVDVATRIECRADAAAAILDAVHDTAASLIAMTTDVVSDLDRWLRGSVSDQVLRHSSVPVLVVPLEVSRNVVQTTQGIGTRRGRAFLTARTWPRTARRLRILVPLDGSEYAANAIAPARALVGAAATELLLLRVVEEPPLRLKIAENGFLPKWARIQLTEAERYLKTAAEAVLPFDGSVATLAVVGDPPASIAAVAQTHHVDMIAMASHGRGGIDRRLMGSVATATLQQANVPVLIMRPVTHCSLCDSGRADAERGMPRATGGQS